MRQRTTEWLEVTKNGKIGYHERQFKEPYRSTVAFTNWLDSLLDLPHTDTICDIACGEGANLSYLAKRYPNIDFVGIDLNPDLIKWGNKIMKNNKIVNVKMTVGDIYQLPGKNIGKFDGILSFQTLSWLPEFNEPIKKMISLNPKWIGITSLFFAGDVNCKIEVQDYTLPLGRQKYKETYYNVYSLKLVENLFREMGYTLFSAPFEIDIDLEKPKNGGMGTYTIKTVAGKRLQISGPLLMNWYFILAVKILNHPARRRATGLGGIPPSAKAVSRYSKN